MQADTISVGRRQVRFWRGGEGSPLILLHGAVPGADRCWSKIWDGLAASYDVIAPDLPGCGGSQALGRSTLPNLVAWLDGLIDALDLRTVRLVGADAGASIARAFATSLPHRCDALVLINGGVLPSAAEGLLAWLGLARQRQPTAHTLVFWTQDDHPTLQAGQRLAAQLPCAAFRLMPGRGRLPQLEAPLETTDILLAFLG
jgi:pimeloyl-ACP methyl ester carboxylesterase